VAILADALLPVACVDFKRQGIQKGIYLVNQGGKSSAVGSSAKHNLLERKTNYPV
jgi:hypothetical protein